MKPLLLFLILSTAAWGQDSTTTKIFRDVYGNWYDSKGVVETVVQNKLAPTEFIPINRGVEFSGFLDITVGVLLSISQNNLSYHRAVLNVNGKKQPLKVKQVGQRVYILINKKWIEL